MWRPVVSRCAARVRSPLSFHWPLHYTTDPCHAPTTSASRPTAALSAFSCQQAMRFRFLGGSDAPDWLLAEVSVLSKMSSVRMKLIARQIVQQLSGHAIAYDKIAKLTSSTRMQLEPSDIKALIAALHFVYASAVRWAVEGVVLARELEQLGLPKDVCTAMVKEYDVARDELRQHMTSQTLTRQPATHRTHQPTHATVGQWSAVRMRCATHVWKVGGAMCCAVVRDVLCAVPHVTDVDWRVDYVLASSALTVSPTHKRPALTSCPLLMCSMPMSHMSCRVSALPICVSCVQSVNAPSVRLRFHLSKPAAGESVLPCEMTVEQFTLLHAELRTARRVMESLQT